MKPVSLTIAGLQSYREEQRIDFSALCEAGVFGIFGPTGSGKSTILDAITLAMYGIVERAGNSIQGIMNAAEDTLSVAFEFELSDGAQRKRYKAERTYRRKPDGSVEQRLSRLTEKGFDGGETIVLADKSGDVTAHVDKLIGLSMTDFTRAVVLPQGKFSEFLGLKGRERREMLQRLFRLERYGDELAGRLAGRRSRVESRMREAAAELQGLGDASPEAVASAERELADAVLLEGASLERLTALEMKHAEMMRLWEWQEEARTLAAERTSLLARESEMAQLEALLADAAAADRLLPLWTERRECEERAERLGAELLRLESLHAEAGVREAAAREAHGAVERTLSEGEAPALVRLEQLRQAMELAEQARAGERAAAGWAAAKEKALAERNGCAETLEKKTAMRAKGAAKQSELKRELAAADVTAEERKLLAAAQGARNAWMLAAKAASSAKAEAEAYARAAEDREAAVRRLEEQTASAAARLLPLRQSLGVLSTGLKDTESVLAALEDTLPLHISAAASALIGDERKKWALALAEGLQPGESCPVCGSAHHPGRAVPETDGTETEQHAQQDKLQALEKLLVDVRQLSARIRKESVAAENGLERLSIAAQLPLEVTAAEWSQSAAEAAVSLIEDKGSSEMSELFGERQSFVQTAAAQIPAIVADIGSSLQYWEDCRGRLRDAVAAHAAALGVSEAAGAKANTAAFEAVDAQAAWEREFPGLSPETWEERVRDLERRDETSRELRERLEKSEQFLADIALELDALQRELAEKEKALAHAGAQEAAEARSLAQIKDALSRVVGDGGDASVQAQELQKKLERWREAERAARAAAEEARLALEEAGRSLAAGNEALKGAKERLQSAESRWIEAVQQSPFESEEDLLSRRLSEERRKSMEEEAARYRESVTSIAARLEAVLQRLNGKTVEEAEWKESAEALQAAKAQRETALMNRAKAERWAEQLREKHEQWTKLTKEHEQLSSLHGQLSKLHTVFRGNAFVEFLAEEQLYGVTRAASDRLAQLTRGRYAIEVDSGGGFVIRDDANGGIRRPVSTLSGGETFLTSLSLALALSAQIQLGGKYPLEFFFLDEGFGTLDPELLDNVVTALERLHIERFSVGVISHVPELQARLPRKLVVTPAEPFGAGSRVRMESM